jgi:hypothetical protein
MIAAVSLLGAAVSLHAHHAINGEYDLNVPRVQKTGVLVKAENVNPHPKWYFDVTMPDGKVEHWLLQTTAPGALLRMGIKPKSDLQIGATYTFQAAPARDGSTLGIVTSLTMPDGRHFDFKYAPGENADAPVGNAH